MSPGITTLTRTLRGAASLATYAHSPDRAALLAAYPGLSVVLTTRTAVDEVRTIAAPGGNSGSVCLQYKNGERRLVAMILSQSADVVPFRWSPTAMPTL